MFFMDKFLSSLLLKPNSRLRYSKNLNFLNWNLTSVTLFDLGSRY
jgi:hypothetical protein